MEPKITVAIVSWLLEDRLMKTLRDIPNNTSQPLNLCLHVQGAEQISVETKQAIIDSASGFVNKDIYFTEGNRGIAPPRSENLKRAATTPFIFMSDNDMDYAKDTIDKELEFLNSNPDFGMVDVLFNEMKYHRTVKGTKVNCFPIDLSHPHTVEVDLIGGTSVLIRQEVALTLGIIDTRYCVGSWDFDFSMNVRKAGWKIATIVDPKLMARNDKSFRTAEYAKNKVKNSIIEQGRRLFENKWGFSCMYFPNHKSKPQITYADTIVTTRAIYNNIGVLSGMGVLDPSRLNMMQKNFINSLKNQTDPNFKVCVFVGAKDNVATKQMETLDWGDLKVQFIYTTNDLSQWKRSVTVSQNWGREMDEGSPEDIAHHTPIPHATITARMDNDDWVGPGWIAHMKAMAKEMPEDRFLINYQVFGQAPDGRIYEFYAPHVKKRTSPFIAIVQKNVWKTHIYETVHLRMGDLFETVYTIPPSYAFMVIHSGNRSNQVYIQDKYIYTKETATDQIASSKIQTGPRIIQPSKPKLSITVRVAARVKPSWRDRLAQSQDRLNILQTGANQ